MPCRRIKSDKYTFSPDLFHKNAVKAKRAPNEAITSRDVCVFHYATYDCTRHDPTVKKVNFKRVEMVDLLNS